MFEIKARDKMVERALLVGAYVDASQKAEAESLLEELEELVNTLGIPVVERQLVHHREPHARFLVGSGKAEEIAALIKERECDVLIFDNVLTPAQQRNFEELTGVTVADRQEIILDIFGARARTREARIQVDVARMEYSLPRLTRAWSHLGQQGAPRPCHAAQGPQARPGAQRRHRRLYERRKIVPVAATHRCGCPGGKQAFCHARHYDPEDRAPQQTAVAADRYRRVRSPAAA